MCLCVSFQKRTWQRQRLTGEVVILAAGIFAIVCMFRLIIKCISPLGASILFLCSSFTFHVSIVSHTPFAMTSENVLVYVNTATKIQSDVCSFCLFFFSSLDSTHTHREKKILSFGYNLFAWAANDLRVKTTVKLALLEFRMFSSLFFDWVYQMYFPSHVNIEICLFPIHRMQWQLNVKKIRKKNTIKGNFQMFANGKTFTCSQCVPHWKMADKKISCNIYTLVVDSLLLEEWYEKNIYIQEIK